MVAQTYQEFSHKFDLAHRALNGGLPLEYALSRGYPIQVHGEYLPHLHHDFDLHLTPHKPKPSHHMSYQFDIYRFGNPFGLAHFDPGHYGYVHGRPNQGYGNWLAGKPHIPEPDWPRLEPNRPRWKPY